MKRKGKRKKKIGQKRWRKARRGINMKMKNKGNEAKGENGKKRIERREGEMRRGNIGGKSIKIRRET